VQCESCGTVAAVPDCVVDDAAAQIEATTGFQVRAHRLVLTGLCPDCRPG
jgi:Fe2+ or Zn2+ uptake regulation protein